MHSYASALVHYLRCEPLNNRAKKWLAMPAEARPLESRRHDWKAIHRTPDGIIYFRFWRTHLATFHPPGVDGSYHVVLSHYVSPTTQQFERQFNICYYRMTAQDGKRAYLPYVDNTTTHLWFDKNDLLIRERSYHTPVYTNILGEEDKEKRAHIKDKLGSLVTLMQMRLPEFKANARIDHNLGVPFGGATYRGRNGNRAQEIHALKDLVIKEGGFRDPLSFDFENQEFVSNAVGAAQDVFDILASKRCYKEYCVPLTWRGGLNPAAQARIKEKADVIVNAVTPEDFGKAYMTRLLNVFGAKPTGKRDVGQFPESLPHKWVR